MFRYIRIVKIDQTLNNCSEVFTFLNRSETCLQTKKGAISQKCVDRSCVNRSEMCT